MCALLKDTWSSCSWRFFMLLGHHWLRHPWLRHPWRSAWLLPHQSNCHVSLVISPGNSAVETRWFIGIQRSLLQQDITRRWSYSDHQLVNLSSISSRQIALLLYSAYIGLPCSWSGNIFLSGGWFRGAIVNFLSGMVHWKPVATTPYHS